MLRYGEDSRKDCPNNMFETTALAASLQAATCHVTQDGSTSMSQAGKPATEKDQLSLMLHILMPLQDRVGPVKNKATCSTHCSD